MLAGTKSQELVLAQVHPLNDVPTIVKHSLDVLRIDGTCKVRITIVLAVAARCAYTLQNNPIEKFYIARTIKHDP